MRTGNPHSCKTPFYAVKVQCITNANDYSVYAIPDSSLDYPSLVSLELLLKLIVELRDDAITQHISHFECLYVYFVISSD